MSLPHKQAQEYLRAWYSFELTHIRDFQKWKAQPNLYSEYQDSFSEALDYFDALWWVGPEKVPTLMSLTLRWVNGSTPDSVDAFALKLAQLMGQKMTSLASKILFLNKPHKISPTSAEVRAAVGLKTDNYRKYRELMAAFYQKYRLEIDQNLITITPALLEIEKKFDNQITNLQKVRINRYTDQLLRVKGSQALDVSAVESESETAIAYIKPARIEELRAIYSPKFDMKRLVRFCKELNRCYADGSTFAVEMIVRSIQEHVRPIFKIDEFEEVLSEYREGSPAFRESMGNLVRLQRPKANHYLHDKIGPQESLPSKEDPNFTAELDALLQEVVLILSRESAHPISLQ